MLKGALLFREGVILIRVSYHLKGYVRLKTEVPTDYWYGILLGCAPSLLIIVIASLPKSSAIPSGYTSASP